MGEGEREREFPASRARNFTTRHRSALVVNCRGQGTLSHRHNGTNKSMAATAAAARWAPQPPAGGSRRCGGAYWRRGRSSQQQQSATTVPVERPQGAAAQGQRAAAFSKARRRRTGESESARRRDAASFKKEPVRGCSAAPMGLPEIDPTSLQIDRGGVGRVAVTIDSASKRSRLSHSTLNAKES